jgi:hypothetical protein
VATSRSPSKSARKPVVVKAGSAHLAKERLFAVQKGRRPVP